MLNVGFEVQIPFLTLLSYDCNTSSTSIHLSIATNKYFGVGRADTSPAF